MMNIWVTCAWAKPPETQTPDPATPNHSHPATEQANTETIIRYLLDQDLGHRKFPFPDVIKASSGHQVLSFDNQNAIHQLILNVIDLATAETVKELNRKPSPLQKLRRINEASRHVEESLRHKINATPRFTCTIPQNDQGHPQRSGYPDLHITYTGENGILTHIYLDPKLFEKKSRASTLRTFYFQPRTRTQKIQHDAIHLLVGIQHDGKQADWTFGGWDVCDLSKFHVRLKAEFHASNRELYRPETIIRHSSLTHKASP